MEESLRFEEMIMNIQSNMNSYNLQIHDIGTYENKFKNYGGSDISYENYDKIPYAGHGIYGKGHGLYMTRGSVSCRDWPCGNNFITDKSIDDRQPFSIRHYIEIGKLPQYNFNINQHKIQPISIMSHDENTEQNYYLNQVGKLFFPYFDLNCENKFGCPIEALHPKFAYYFENNTGRDITFNRNQKNFDFNMLGVSNFKTNQVTNMKGMFSSCKNFDKDISEWNTNNVTDMSNMFNNCEIFNQDISKWNTSNVTDMSNMFNNCKKFNKDISEWNTSNVTDMSNMFNNCEEFVQEIWKWNISNVKNLNNTFKNCKFVYSPSLDPLNNDPRDYIYLYKLEKSWKLQSKLNILENSDIYTSIENPWNNNNIFGYLPNHIYVKPKFERNKITNLELLKNINFKLNNIDYFNFPTGKKTYDDVINKKILNFAENNNASTTDIEAFINEMFSEFINSFINDLHLEEISRYSIAKICLTDDSNVIRDLIPYSVSTMRLEEKHMPGDGKEPAGFKLFYCSESEQYKPWGELMLYRDKYYIYEKGKEKEFITTPYTNGFSKEDYLGGI